MSEKREFTGVFIPANIWGNPDLTPAEKMLLGEIDSLSRRTGWCEASREHFATWLHCDPTNISHYVAKLEKLGFLQVQRVAGRRNKMRVVNARFYDTTPVSQIHGGGEWDSRVGVNGAHGGGEWGSPEIQEKYKNKSVLARAHENEPESFNLEAEKNTPSPIPPAPSPAAGRRANTSDEAENLIRAWANGDGKETVRNWIAETTFSEKVHGRVRDEITKFVGHYAVSEKPGVSYKMFADPVLFFQNRFKAWLVQAKELNRPANNQRAAAAATYEPPRRILN